LVSEYLDIWLFGNTIYEVGIIIIIFLKKDLKIEKNKIKNNNQIIIK